MFFKCFTVTQVYFTFEINFLHIEFGDGKNPNMNVKKQNSLNIEIFLIKESSLNLQANFTLQIICLDLTKFVFQPIFLAELIICQAHYASKCNS